MEPEKGKKATRSNIMADLNTRMTALEVSLEINQIRALMNFPAEPKASIDRVEQSIDGVRRNMDDLHRWNRYDVLYKRAETLRAVRDEIEGRESEAEAMVAAYKQKVIDVQWALAERGPRVEELLSNPLARDAFSPQNVAMMFGALDRDPKHVKAQILSDVLKLERAQIANGAGAGGSELESTKVTRELLEFWGPTQARLYWDTIVGTPLEFSPISEDQVARFGYLLG